MTATIEAPPQRRTYTLLAGLYVSQFLGVGFFYTGLVGILRDGGASLTQLGFIQLLGLVWGIKFLWAPIVDRYGSQKRGHSTSWLVWLQPGIAVGLLAMAFIDPVGDFSTLMVLAALIVLLSATQDVAADALAVRILNEGSRGVGNAIQVAGGYIGNIIGGGGALIVYDYFGWSAALVTLAVFSLLPLWQILTYREPARGVGDTATRPSIGEFVRLFRVPGAARWALILLPVVWIGVSSAYSLTTPMLVDAGWDLAQIGVLTTIVAGMFAIGAAIGTGFLMRRFDRRVILIAACVLQTAAILLLLPLASGAAPTVFATVVVCFLNLSYGAISTVIYTVNMDFSRPSTAGSDYTLLASFGFIASLLAGATGLGIADAVGYGWVLAGSAALVGIIALTTPWLLGGRLERAAHARDTKTADTHDQISVDADIAAQPSVAGPSAIAGSTIANDPHDRA